MSVKIPANAHDLAFSYLRFSSPSQAEGDSLRRQNSLRDAWLTRNPNVRLDTSLTLVDAGVSGFKGANRTNKKHALAIFLDLVERGRVPGGSYLIVENLDRLTRETPVDAIPAVLALIKAGIRVVQLAPTEVIYHSQMDMGALMIMLLELSRGHSESKRKSGLNGEVWKEKKGVARTNKVPYGRMCPAWLELEGVKSTANGPDYSEAHYRVKADAAAAVRRVFQLCADGIGKFRTLEILNAEGVPPIGRLGVWERSYVKKLLCSESVLGIYQPMKGWPKPKPDGEKIEGYYPAIISEELWWKAREAITNRTKKTGRTPTKNANPFSGLLHCAIERCAIHIVGTKGPQHKYLVPHAATINRKGATWRAFRFDVFRRTVLDELSELKAADLFADPGAVNLVALQTQLADVERRLANATVRFEADPESQHWQNLVSKYDKEKRAVVKDLANEKQRSENPLSAAWVETVELMERDEPERLRAGLLSVIENVWCVFVSSGGWKYAAVQVWFKGTGHRSYIIAYRQHRGPKKEGQQAVTKVVTLSETDLSADIDFRKPRDAKIVDAYLHDVDAMDELFRD